MVEEKCTEDTFASLSKMPGPSSGAVVDECSNENHWSQSCKEKQKMKHYNDVTEEERGLECNFSSFIACISAMSAPLARIVEDAQLNGNGHSPWSIVRQALECSSILVEEKQCTGSNYSPLTSMSALLRIADEGQSSGSNFYSVVSRSEGPSGCRNLDLNQPSKVVCTELEESSFGLHPLNEVCHHQLDACDTGKGFRDDLLAAPSCDRKQRLPMNYSVDSRRPKNPKISHLHFEQGSILDESYWKDKLELTRRQNHRNALLSLLIDNGVVLLGEEVSYIDKRDCHAIAKGQITHNGIKCNCCSNFYGLSKFELHAGNSNHRPALHIFLQDGRSLYDCQLQLAGVENLKGSKYVLLEKTKTEGFLSEGDICFVCRGGGELVLCTHCPSSYHLSCLGLEDMPEGEWYCPSCRCGKCDQGKFFSDTEVYTEKTVIYCDQCKQEYHVGCLGERELMELRRCPRGTNWFCGIKCSEIYSCLHELLGKPIPLGIQGLTWTILSKKEKHHHISASIIDSITEYHRKLLVARRILDECYDWMPNPITNRGIIVDVLFNKQSELKRSDYGDFYSMLLERGNEVLSVATFRIFGEKVAEVPLIGTRRKYRRQGMCYLLMNELIKIISSLGVEKLLMPVTPALLKTWTTSFGFTIMTRSERLQVIQHTFLEFQGTTMCQKILMTSITTEVEPRVSMHSGGDFNHQGSVV